MSHVVSAATQPRRHGGFHPGLLSVLRVRGSVLWWISATLQQCRAIPAIHARSEREIHPSKKYLEFFCHSRSFGTILAGHRIRGPTPYRHLGAPRRTSPVPP